MSIADLPVPHPTFLDRQGNVWYRWKDTLVLPQVADMYGERKRLTDPELGAILWFHVSREAQAEVMGWQTDHAQDWINTNQEECRIVRILERFAALPHYDEPTQ